MSNADPRLGPYGIYDKETVDCIGVRAGLVKTLEHLDFSAGQSRGGKGGAAHEKVRSDEASRIRGVLYGARNELT
jgi:hypothetical protein